MSNNIDEYFEDETSDDDPIFNKYKSFSPENKIILTNLSLWEKFQIYWKYGLKVKQL